VLAWLSVWSEVQTQLMPLPLTVSCFSKIQIGLPFWYRLTQIVPEKGPLNGCVCVTWTITIMGFGIWQWHQLDHMQTVCTSLYIDNYTSTS